MKKKIYSFFCVYLFLIGCDSENSEKKKALETTVVINKIEKSLTQNNTTLGCDDNKTKVCLAERDSSAFILNTLAKEEESSVIEGLNTLSLKEKLNNSLEEISKEEMKTDELKENLVAFVNSTRHNRGKALEKFIDKIEEEKKLEELTDSTRITLIKNELNNLMLLEKPLMKSKEVKIKLENLMSDISLSERTLSQTKTTLKNLVTTAEKRGKASDKKFVNAIIQDVSSKKISILEETKDYFIITVQEGDNLSILAKRYYSNTDKFKLIYEANKDKINSKYEIYPGSKLLIPKI